MTPEIKRTIDELHDAGLNGLQIAAKLGISKTSVYTYLAERKVRDESDCRQQTEEVYSDGGNILEKSFVTTEPIKSEDDAMRAANIDPLEWTCERLTVRAWTVTVKTKDDKGKEQSQLVQNYGVKLVLRRNPHRYLLKSVKQLIDSLAERAPVYHPLPPRIPPSGEPLLAVCGLADVHFGKLSWHRETGENYDLNIAVELWREAVSAILSRAQVRRIVRFVLPLGNDLFHADGKQQTTYRGTRVDCDGRFSKVWDIVLSELIHAIEMLQTLAVVQLPLVPGNHDSTAAVYLAEVLAARFRHNNRVIVDREPSSRKYIEWGTNLLGFDHGDRIPRQRLVTLMQAERPVSWGRTTCREWIRGHWHHETVYQQGGVVIRHLPTITGTDVWHYDEGYIGAPRGTHLLLYGYDSGHVATEFLPVRRSQSCPSQLTANGMSSADGKPS